MVFYACVYQKLAETDCRCKIGRKWRLHDVAVGIPRRACWFEREEWDRMTGNDPVEIKTEFSPRND